MRRDLALTPDSADGATLSLKRVGQQRRRRHDDGGRATRDPGRHRPPGSSRSAGTSRGPWRPGSLAALAEGGVRAFELTLNEPEADALAADRGRCAGRVGARPRCRRRDRPLDRGGAARHRCGRDVPRHAPPGRRARRLGGRARHPGLSRAPRRRPRSSPRGVPARPPSSSSRRRRSGPAFVREMRGPLPDIPLVPTGGVTLETAPAFIAAGAVAVGMGGWLIGDGDRRPGSEERARRVVERRRERPRGARPDDSRRDRGRHPRGVPHRVRRRRHRGRWRRPTTFERFVAGAEANVAVGLARLGHEVAFIGRVGARRLRDGDRPPAPRRGRRRRRT